MFSWSAGCIFAEISNSGVPLFPGNDVDDQLKRIFKVLGTPNDRTWSNVSKLPDYKQFPQYQAANNWSQITPHLDRNALDLLKSLIVCNPNERMTAQDALQHKYFNGIETNRS